MIELSQFIESTLFDIALGVQKAKLRSADLAAIAPNRIDDKEMGETTYVEFDIAVRTAESQTSKQVGVGKIGARARIWVVDASAELGRDIERGSENNSEHAHRINFKVPIYLNAHFRNDALIKADAEYIRRAEEADV